MKRIAVMVLIVFLLPSCATSYRPLVDPASIVDRDRYERDLSECAALADENVKSHQAATGAAGGALFGAGLGALLSWIFGGSGGTGAAAGAVVGGVSGGVSGAGAAAGDYETIYRNCMLGRGWRVLR
jgi:outer membrane lipoprotein SlyB